MPPGIPACVQSVARAGVRMPDHACPYESVENNNNIKIRGERCESPRLIYLWPPTRTFTSYEESLAASRQRTLDTEVRHPVSKEHSPLILGLWPSVRSNRSHEEKAFPARIDVSGIDTSDLNAGARFRTAASRWIPQHSRVRVTGQLGDRMPRVVRIRVIL